MVLLAPGMGDGIQAAKAGILEIGDVYVVNKADRDGADATVRELRHMLALGERRGPGDWRPPIVKTVAAAARASTRSSRRSTSTAPGWRRPARCASAGARRAAGEIETIALTALRERIGDLRARGGATAWTRWPPTWWPGAPTRTPPPTACWTASPAASGRLFSGRCRGRPGVG